MFRSIAFYFFIAFILAMQQAFPLSLREKFKNYTSSSGGSFIVTEHQKTVSFLRFRSFEDPILFLEEINIPSHFLPKKPVDWNLWLKNKAPHHTSWLLYQIDLNRCKIVDCYSFSRESYIALHEQQSFLTTLMTLPLEEVPTAERKKIGSQSDQDSLNTGKVWNPPKIVEGKKHLHPHFEMMHAQWPKDGSDLSGKLIDLYFDKDQPLFPFPYWIEIGDGHNVFKIRVLDSGTSLQFPFKQPPIHPPIIDKVTSISLGLDIRIKDALSFKDFQVIISTNQGNTYSSTPLPCTLSVEGNTTHLYISRSTLLQHILLDTDSKTKTLYTLSVIPLDHPEFIMEYPHPIQLHSP